MIELLFRVKNGTPEEEACLGDTDFRAHFSSINKGLSWHALKVNIRKVTENHIIPYVGEDFYNAFAERYAQAGIVGDPNAGIVIGDPDLGIVIGSGDLEDYEVKLLEILRDAIAEYTVWHAINERTIKLSDAGVRKELDSGNHSEPAMTWEAMHYAWKRMLEGDRYLDKALAFLDANQDDFPDYVAGMPDLETYPMFLRTAAELKKYLPVIADQRRTWRKVQPAMANVNRRELLPILGESLYNDLLENYRTGELTAADTVLLPFVQRLAAICALLDSLPLLAVLIEDEGIRVITSSQGMNTRQLAHDRRLEELRSQLLDDCARAKGELTSFLYCNLEDYPDFATSTAYLNLTDYTNEQAPYCFGDGGVFL